MRGTAVLFVVIGLAGFYLTSTNKLVPIVDTLIGPSVSASSTVPNLTTWTVAILVLLFVLSVLPHDDSAWFALLIASGALIINRNTVFSQLKAQ